MRQPPPDVYQNLVYAAGRRGFTHEANALTIPFKSLQRSTSFSSPRRFSFPKEVESCNESQSSERQTLAYEREGTGSYTAAMPPGGQQEQPNRHAHHSPHLSLKNMHPPSAVFRNRHQDLTSQTRREAPDGLGEEGVVEKTLLSPTHLLC